MSTRLPPVKHLTPARLITAARRLVAEHGVEAVSVRDIHRAAGEKNGASLNYHFGTKEDLIREIIRDQFVEMDRRWERRLHKADRSGRSLTLTDLLRIIVEESVRPFEHDSKAVAARVAFVALQRRRHIVMEILKQHRLQAYDNILNQIAELMPVMPPAILRQRLVFLTHYLSELMALHEKENDDQSHWHEAGAVISHPPTHEIQNLIDTGIGLITAPVIDAAPHVIGNGWQRSSIDAGHEQYGK